MLRPSFLPVGTNCGLPTPAAVLVMPILRTRTCANSTLSSADDIGLSAALTGTSCKTCGELGWYQLDPGSAITAFPSVCGASKVFGGAAATCSKRLVTFDQALEICSIAGARLCSVEEAAAGVARDTQVGCSLQTTPLSTDLASSANWMELGSGPDQRPGVVKTPLPPSWTLTGLPFSSSGVMLEISQLHTRGVVQVRDLLCVLYQTPVNMRSTTDEVTLKADMTCEELRNDYKHLSQRDGALVNGWSRLLARNTPVCASSYTAFNATGDLIVSANPDDRCQSGTPIQAEKICAMTGARLCTVNELTLYSYGTGTSVLHLAVAGLPH